MENELNIIQHVLAILYIDIYEYKLLLAKGDIYVNNMVNNNYGTYQSIVNKKCYTLLPTYMKHIVIFQN